MLISGFVVSSAPAMGEHGVFKKRIDRHLHVLLFGTGDVCFSSLVARRFFIKGIELFRSAKLA